MTHLIEHSSFSFGKQAAKKLAEWPPQLHRPSEYDDGLLPLGHVLYDPVDDLVALRVRRPRTQRPQATLLLEDLDRWRRRRGDPVLDGHSVFMSVFVVNAKLEMSKS